MRTQQRVKIQLQNVIQTSLAGSTHLEIYSSTSLKYIDF